MNRDAELLESALGGVDFNSLVSNFNTVRLHDERMVRRRLDRGVGAAPHHNASPLTEQPAPSRRKRPGSSVSEDPKRTRFHTNEATRPPTENPEGDAMKPTGGK